MNIDYLNPPEHLLNQAIKPWQPQIGDRVRVHPGHECELCRISEDPSEDGATATVTGIETGEETEPHVYLVRFDQDPHDMPWDIYAAFELEPLDDES